MKKLFLYILIIMPYIGKSMDIATLDTLLEKLTSDIHYQDGLDIVKQVLPSLYSDSNPNQDLAIKQEKVALYIQQEFEILFNFKCDISEINSIQREHEEIIEYLKHPYLFELSKFDPAHHALKKLALNLALLEQQENSTEKQLSILQNKIEQTIKLNVIADIGRKNHEETIDKTCTEKLKQILITGRTKEIADLIHKQYNEQT